MQLLINYLHLCHCCYTFIIYCNERKYYALSDDLKSKILLIANQIRLHRLNTMLRDSIHIMHIAVLAILLIVPWTTGIAVLFHWFIQYTR